MPIDGDRAAFTGQFYAGVNGVSGAMQFFVLPLLRNYLEPQWVYRFLPSALMPLLAYMALAPVSAHGRLRNAAVTFFALKAADYSVRGVATELAYQPLDFDARYLGKEVIGVFANRCGKSGTSVVLSVLAGLGLLAEGTRQMSWLAVGVGALWSACSLYLSHHVVTNRQAGEKVLQRRSQKETTAGAVALEAKSMPKGQHDSNSLQPADGDERDNFVSRTGESKASGEGANDIRFRRRRQ